MFSIKSYVFAGVAALTLFSLLSLTLRIQNLELHDVANRKSFGLGSGSQPNPTNSSVVEIPNIANFVFILPEGKTDFSFSFYHYLSIYSVQRHWSPDSIYLHTNADLDAINRARNGSRGKWSKRIFSMPGLRINYHEPPKQSYKGKNITAPEHMSDFTRVEVVLEYGGVYLDFDVFALRDVKPLLRAGFNALMGRELYGKLNCGVFASQPHSKALRLFLEGMHDVFDPGSYAAHCVLPMTEVGERLVADNGELLIVDREGFHPVGFEPHEAEELFRVHNEAPSNLEGINQGDTLLEHKPAEYDHWHWIPKDKWNRHFYASYTLHAFHIERFNITPRLVLERQSIFSRAVYPTARAMYVEGLIEIEDTAHG